MIKSVATKIDGKTITLLSPDEVNWYVSSIAPNKEGVYPVTLTVKTDKNVYTYTTDHKKIGDYLKLYVSDYNSKLIEYLPQYLREVREFKEIFDSEDIQLNILCPLMESIFNEVLVMQCSEERLSQWEKALSVTPTGTVEERRYFIKALLRGSGKLNENKIKSIVEAFTDGEALVSFENSVINVKVLPPNNGEVYRFPDVERALKPLVPAHLGLSVMRYYSTWGDIKNNFGSWDTVKQSENWNEVKNYIAP